MLALFVGMWALDIKSGILGLERSCCSGEMSRGRWSGVSIVDNRMGSLVREVGISQIGYVSL